MIEGYDIYVQELISEFFSGMVNVFKKYGLSVSFDTLKIKFSLFDKN